MTTLDDDFLPYGGAASDSGTQAAPKVAHQTISAVAHLVNDNGKYILITNGTGTDLQQQQAPVTSVVSSNPGTHEQSSLSVASPQQLITTQHPHQILSDHGQLDNVQITESNNFVPVLPTQANQSQISVFNHGLPAHMQNLGMVSHLTLDGDKLIPMHYTEAHQQVLVDTQTPPLEQSTKTTLDKGVRDILISSNDKTKITVKTDEPEQHHYIVKKYDDSSKVWEGDLEQGQVKEVQVQKSVHYIFKRLTETNHERDERIRVEKLLNSRLHRKRKNNDAESKNKIPAMESNIEDLQKRVSVLEKKGFRC